MPDATAAPDRAHVAPQDRSLIAFPQVTFNRAAPWATAPDEPLSHADGSTYAVRASAPGPKVVSEAANRDVLRFIL